MAHYRVAKFIDSIEPLNPPPGYSAYAGYIGGDTPHVLSDQQWDDLGAVRKIPIFVRSQIVGRQGGIEDAFNALRQLYHLRVPKQSIVIYDRETNSDADATQGFGDVMHWADYFAMPYGSKDNIFAHPALDGIWIADPTGVPHMFNHPGVNATQYDTHENFDESEIKLWVLMQRVKIW